jgi:hypothetical protein
MNLFKSSKMSTASNTRSDYAGTGAFKLGKVVDKPSTVGRKVDEAFEGQGGVSSHETGYHRPTRVSDEVRRLDQKNVSMAGTGSKDEQGLGREMQAPPDQGTGQKDTDRGWTEMMRDVILGPEKDYQIQDADYQILEKEVTIPAKEFTIPESKLTVPAREVVVPSKTYYVPEKKVVIPAKEITVPARKIMIPEKKILVPDRVIVGDAKVMMPDREIYTKVSVPEEVHRSGQRESVLSKAEHHIASALFFAGDKDKNQASMSVEGQASGQRQGEYWEGGSQGAGHSSSLSGEQGEFPGQGLTQGQSMVKKDYDTRQSRY